MTSRRPTAMTTSRSDAGSSESSGLAEAALAIRWSKKGKPSVIGQPRVGTFPKPPRPIRRIEGQLNLDGDAEGGDDHGDDSCGE